MKPESFETLLERFLDQDLNESEKTELIDRLKNDPRAREIYISRMAIGADLNHRLIPEEPLPQKTEQTLSFRPQFMLLAATLTFLIGIFAWIHSLGPKPVATLLSSDGAAWESSLPSSPGSELVPGFLKLKTGVSTIRFRSGAEVVLEAPAHLVLETPMKGRLLAGSAVIDVPDSAIGFIMETPDGYAVDHGTQFAVVVDESGKNSTFEVLSGEISVHHPPSGEALHLFENESAHAAKKGIARHDNDAEIGNLPEQPPGIRLNPTGPEVTVIRDPELVDKIHPDFLMAKHSSFLSGYDRRSIFSFNLSEIKTAEIESAKLRLILVPCGIGFAARLPETSQFSIYGTTANVTGSVDWQSAPKPEDATPLGSFSISRGQRTGSFGIETPELLNFLKANRDRTVTFILTRDTDEAKGNGMVHAFASSSHPEASGPSLEIQ